MEKRKTREPLLPSNISEGSLLKLVSHMMLAQILFSLISSILTA